MSASQRVLVIGGSGLLGSFTCAEAARRGYQVRSLARSPHALPGVECVSGDVHQMGREALKEACAGCDAVVYALGLDDRQPHARPSFDVFFADHVTVCLEVLRAAREVGVRKVVVFGSYFSWLDRARPELQLAVHHPYVRSRCAQREAVLAEARDGFETCVLELPYILGCSPGRVPPWTFLFSMLAGPVPLFFDTGGTAAVTAKQVGQAALGAIETAGSGSWPLGGVNWTWRQLATKFFAVVGRQRRVWSLAPFWFVFFGKLTDLWLGLQGLQRGLDVGRFVEVQYADVFVEPSSAQTALGYPHDDYEGALREVVTEWLRQRRTFFTSR